ncbi:hypothetical protein DFH08DRAFT_860135, partial [Mycena albidolilacea]
QSGRLRPSHVPKKILILLFPTQRNAFLKEVAALQTTLQEREEELALSRAESRLAQEEVASANATAAQLQAQLDAGSAFAASLEESNAILQRKHEELKIRLEGLEPPPSVMTYRNVDPSLEIDLDSPPNSEADPMPLLVTSAASSPETPGVIVVRPALSSHRPAKAPRLSVARCFKTRLRPHNVTLCSLSSYLAIGLLSQPLH